MSRFSRLGLVPRVVVTGPQRAGTTICARMIAADSGHRYVDEEDFGTYDVDRWRDCVAPAGVVVHCPTMFKTIVDERDPNLYVVLVRRSLEEIHESQARIGWDFDSIELRPFGLTEGDSAAVKYAYWDASLKPPFHEEVEFSSLEDHPLWVPAIDRRVFTARQTTR